MNKKYYDKVIWILPPFVFTCVCSIVKLTKRSFSIKISWILAFLWKFWLERKTNNLNLYAKRACGKIKSASAIFGVGNTCKQQPKIATPGLRILGISLFFAIFDDIPSIQEAKLIFWIAAWLWAVDISTIATEIVIRLQLRCHLLIDQDLIRKIHRIPISKFFMNTFYIDALF